MRISVIIVTRNRKELISHCLNKIEKQHFRPLEVIVVDNGSNVHSTLFLKNYNFSDKGIKIKKIFFEKNMGLTYARNKGAERATGKIIIWMDNDTFFEDPNAMTLILDEFEKDSDLGILTYPVHEFLQDSTERYLIPRPRTPYKYGHEFETSYFLGGANAMDSNMFKKYGMFDENLVYQLEELDFMYKVARDKIKIKYTPIIEIIHKPPHAKFRSDRYYYFHIRNRIWIACRYLPQPYFIAHLSVWILRLFFKSLLDNKIVSFSHGLIEGVKAIPKNFKIRKNMKLNKESINWLQQRYGRVWY